MLKKSLWCKVTDILSRFSALRPQPSKHDRQFIFHPRAITKSIKEPEIVPFSVSKVHICLRFAPEFILGN